LEELHLTRFYRGYPEALKNFLKWPKALKVFTIDELAMNGYDWEYLQEWNNCCKWTYNQLLDLLSRQESTLQVLRIGEIGPENIVDLNINRFVALKTFQICCSGARPTPAAACSNWALANLKKLVLECSYCDSQNGVVPFFDQDLSQWLQDFAKLAAEQKRLGSIALEEIELLYYTDNEWLDIDERPRLLMETKQRMEDPNIRIVVTYTDRYPPVED
jgi:hypothetical protein